jgi:hypothetical protein
MGTKYEKWLNDFPMSQTEPSQGRECIWAIIDSDAFLSS